MGHNGIRYQMSLWEFYLIAISGVKENTEKEWLYTGIYPTVMKVFVWYIITKKEGKTS